MLDEKSLLPDALVSGVPVIDLSVQELRLLFPINAATHSDSECLKIAFVIRGTRQEPIVLINVKGGE